jgi:hypothetical protein
LSDPEIIAELRRISDENGGVLRAVDVVQAAKREASPLHTQFDWDDSEAAHKWRLHQARNLIRVTVEYIGEGEERTPARVFVSLTPDRNEDGGCYRATAAVMSDAKYRAQLLADARAEMERFEKKYSDLQELAEVFAAISRALRRPAA